MINITSDFEENSKSPGGAGASAILLCVYCKVIFNSTFYNCAAKKSRGFRGTFTVNFAAINLNSAVNGGIFAKVLTDKMGKILKQMQ